MMKTIVTLSLLVAVLSSPASAVCLRVMTPQELVVTSILIARVRVTDTDDSDWGEFGQIATLELVDIIEGDFTLRDARVHAKSHVACADDQYKKKDEFLVFLEQSGGLYHTVNFQYGQFRIEGEVVRGWRNADGGVSEKPYYSVREEIEGIVAGIRNPKQEGVPTADPNAPAPPPGTPPPAAQGSPEKPKASLVPSVKKPKPSRERVSEP
jgi:hypothetical protein